MKKTIDIFLILLNLLFAVSVGFAQNKIPCVDLSACKDKHSVIAAGTEETYQGHPYSVMLSDNKTIFLVWNIGHGGFAGPMAKSTDAGKTWTRLDERLPEGFKKHKNCPSIYRMTNADGKDFLWVFTSQPVFARIVSADGGNSWQEEKPLGFHNVMAFSSIIPKNPGIQDGKYIGFFHRVCTGEGKPLNMEPRPKNSRLQVVSSETQDAGFSWSKPKVIADLPIGPKLLCEPCAFWSPDKKEICCLMRENTHKSNSYMTFSQDNGQTWTKPVETAWELTGDRHEGGYLADGRLIFAFRDQAIKSPTRGHFVAWVGSYEDLKNARPGDYRIKLLHSWSGGDCGYPGVHTFANGDVFALTYIKYDNSKRKHSVVGIRFNIAETDKMAKKINKNDNMACPGNNECKETTASSSNKKHNYLVINEDNDHYFKLNSKLMTRQALEQYIDQFGGTKVTHFFMCPNGQRTSFRSKVHESIWDNIDRFKKPDIWSVNAKKLFDQGIDPYAVWTERCRKNKISPWLTVRMNDVHFVTTPGHFRNTDFWQSHSNLWRIPGYKGSEWGSYALNYAKKEVREYQLSLIRELLERYDIDGIELDWMRFGWHLTPGRELEETRFLTEFVTETRRLIDETAQKRGHSIKLGVRVPSDPVVAAQLGMNAIIWAQKDLLDWLTVSNFFTSSDYYINIDDWKRKIGPTKRQLVIIPSNDNGTTAGPSIPRTLLDPALIRGWAVAVEFLGADSIYLFNFVYLPFETPEFRSILDKGLQMSTVLNMSRRHPVSYLDFAPKKYDQKIQLPKTINTKITLTINIGKKPNQGTAKVVLALQNKDEFPKILLNGIAPNNSGVKQINDSKIIKKYCESAKLAVEYEFPLTALKDGINTIVTEERVNSKQKILWAEIACGNDR